MTRPRGMAFWRHVWISLLLGFFLNPIIRLCLWGWWNAGQQLLGQFFIVGVLFWVFQVRAMLKRCACKHKLDMHAGFLVRFGHCALCDCEGPGVIQVPKARVQP